MTKKTYSLENLNELLLEQNILEKNEFSLDQQEEAEQREVKTIATTSLVTLVSYMIGLDIEKMENHYKEQNNDLIISLQSNKEASVIRYLCRLRTNLMLHFKKIDSEIIYNLGSGLFKTFIWHRKAKIKSIFSNYFRIFIQS